MSYNPKSSGNTEPTGDNETRNMGNTGGSEPSGGQPTMPSGGYTPPPGSYTPPPPPPQGQGAYTPPPPQGGYTPPPGGYAPPPPQGYGYGAPPPPPPLRTEPFKVDVGQITKTDYQGLFQKYINFLTKPNVQTHEAEIGNANWATVLFNVIGTSIIKFIFALLAGLVYGSAITSQVTSSFSQFQSQTNADLSGMYNFINIFSGVGIIGAIIGLILSPLWFFLGVWIQLIAAKMFGGMPGAANGGFLTHSYLASLSYAPTRIVGAVLSIIPGISILSGLLNLYQIFLTGLSLQAAQRMQPGRAQMAVSIPLLVCVVGGCLFLFICTFAFVAMFVPR